MAKAPSRPRQELGDEFMAMVGNCIAEWANVEDALFRVCWQCLGCPQQQAAIVFYQIPTVEGRMRLVNELVLSLLPLKEPPSGGHDHADVTWWKKIEGDFKDLQQVRGRIAHHRVAIRFDARGHGEPPASWFEIYVSQTQAARGRAADLRLPPLTIDDLREHLRQVNFVEASLSQFFQNGLPKHIGAFSPRAVQLSRSQTPNHHPPTRPGRRRKSSPP
jgi:hypothetical protein